MEFTMVGRDGAGDTETWLMDLPGTPRQQWSPLAVAAALLLIFAILTPFTAVPLARIDAFIPALGATVSVTSFITSILLFAVFWIHPSRALLVLASGYLFVALIVIPDALTFPDAFSPTGLLGAAIAEEEFLPRLFLDRTRPNIIGRSYTILMPMICAIALAILWSRRRSPLDQWLLVVGLAFALETVFTALGGARFSLGFYPGRSLALVTSTLVLSILLAETTRLYARLARSNMMLQRERNNKLMNLEAMAASISHRSIAGGHR
jgi:hypothetical protein